jgi:3',5'-cyclic AMP phosphodiesterase CpdA
MKLVQISDTHFGTERAPVAEALKRWVADQAPDLLVLSGDVTQRARQAQFDAARAYLDRLHVPETLVIPGNHDIPLYNLPARLFDPYGGFRRVFGDDLEPVHEDDDLLVLAVKTTRRYRHIDGEISPEQVERIAARLSAASPRQLRVVVTHQPVAVSRTEDQADLLHGHERAIRRWSEAGADLILGGHIHLPYIAALHERHADLPRRIWAVQAGTALSWRIRYEADNSFNLIKYQPGGSCTVERWDYQRDDEDFSLAGITELDIERPSPRP